MLKVPHRTQFIFENVPKESENESCLASVHTPQNTF